MTSLFTIKQSFNFFNEMLIFWRFFKAKKPVFKRVNERHRCRAKSEQRKRREKREKNENEWPFRFKKSQKISILFKIF
jgi:hypothetical protein